MPEPQNSGNEWLREQAERLRKEREAGAAPKAETVTVRQFLGRFGYSRRGPIIVSTIRKELDSHGLRTSPDFEYQYIDSNILVDLDEDGGEISEEKIYTDPTVRIDILPAAHNIPVRVSPDHKLVKATTLMRMNDYSQLPVMIGERDVKGVVSWNSIGVAYADGRDPKFVRECMESAHELDTDTTLAEAADQIWRYNYVLIRGKDRRITGIVTAADLANQFKQIAYPFLLIGETEHHLRNLVHGRFTVHELKEVSDNDRQISGPHDLTFGGYCQLFEREEWWEKLDFSIDKTEFVNCLRSVRNIRNDVMHFSPDEREQSEFEPLENVVRILRQLARSRRSSA